MIRHVPFSLYMCLVAGIAVAGRVPDPPNDPPPVTWSCGETSTCPNAATPGLVHVNAAFDADGSSSLDTLELQCAIDCLDGNPDPDWTVGGSPVGLAIPHGGRIVFQPKVTFPSGATQSKFLLDRSLHLPNITGTPLVLEGNGVEIGVTPASFAATGKALIRRVPWDGAHHCSVHVMAEQARNWRIQDFAFDTVDSAGHPSPWKGLEIAGTTGLTIERCSFRGLSAGVDLRMAENPLVQDCFFTGGTDADILLLDGEQPWSPGGPPAWTPTRDCTSGVSGCTQAVLRRNWHLGGPAIRSVGTTSLLLDQVAFEPVPSPDYWNGTQALLRWYGMGATPVVQSQQLVIRSLYVESHMPQPLGHIGQYLVLKGRGTVAIDGMTLIGATCTKRDLTVDPALPPVFLPCTRAEQPPFLFAPTPADGGPGLDVIVENVPWGMPDLTFVGDAGSRFWFRNTGGADLRDPVQHWPNGSADLVHVDARGIRDTSRDGDPCPAAASPVPGREGWLFYRPGWGIDDPTSLWVNDGNEWRELRTTP